MQSNGILVSGVRLPSETFLYLLIDGLADKGWVVTIAAADNSVKSRTIFLHKQIRLWVPNWNIPLLHRLLNFVKLLVYLPNWTPGKINLLFQILSRKRSLKDKLRLGYLYFPYGNVRSNIVYFPWLLPSYDYLEWFAGQKIPVVVSLRGSMINIDPHLPDKGEQVKATLRNIFASNVTVHCVSQAILDEAVKYGLDPSRAHIIRPAVDPNFFMPSQAKQIQARFIIVTTGSLVWNKGYEYALLAVRKILDYGLKVEFRIIGEGPERQRIFYTVNDLNLKDSVHLLGRLTPDQVRQELQQSDVFLLTSLSEGISNAVLEAMSCALPVVVTDCGGMKEVITDGVEGLIVPLRDADKIANALIHLAKDDTLRREMGTRARQRILADHTLERQLDQWDALLSGLVVNKSNS